jgi:transcriptional regulator NrdR family protein
MEQLPQKPPKAIGIKCPDCHCTDIRVSRTIKRAGTIRRERVCRHCLRMFITTEFFGFGPATGSR